MSLIWPLIEMCAPVAFAGDCFVMVFNVPPSHACHMVGESVLPSRCRGKAAGVAARVG